MISTITTATVELLSTATTSAVNLIVIATLILLLIQKEIASGIADARARRLSNALTATIVPLVVVFVSVALLKVAEVLR